MAKPVQSCGHLYRLTMGQMAFGLKQRIIFEGNRTLNGFSEENEQMASLPSP